MRKTLGILSAVLVLSSCGSGGFGEIDAEGYYYLVVGGSRPSEVRVVNFVKGEDGIYDYDVPSYSPFITLTVDLGYAGEFTPDYSGKRAFLKEVRITYGEGVNKVEKVYQYQREILPGGIELTYDLTSADLLKPPFIYANALEDRKLPLVFWERHYAEEYWDEVRIEDTFSGRELKFPLLEGYRDLKVKVENTLCLVGEDGSLSAPCEGVVGDGFVSITGLDSSYLRTSHEAVFTYAGSGVREYVLSQGVVKGSVLLEVHNDYFTDGRVIHDEDGKLIGNDGQEYGTIDYDRGVISISIPGYTTVDWEPESEWIGYEAEGEVNLNEKVKPLSVKLEAFDGSPGDENASSVGFCTDDGKGNLVGDCSGTVDYEAGKISYKWEISADAKSVYVAWEKEKVVSEEAQINAKWETLEGNARVEVDYYAPKDGAPMVLEFAKPPASTFSTCKVWEILVGELSEGSDFEVEDAGGYVFLKFLRAPTHQVNVWCEFEKEFNFNKEVEVSSPSPQEIPVEIKVKAVLETGEELENTERFTITAESPTYDL